MFSSLARKAIAKSGSIEPEDDIKISTRILRFLSAQEILCVLPRLNKTIKKELETTYAHIRAQAYERVLIYKHTLSPCMLFRSVTPDSFKYVKLAGGYSNFTYKLLLGDSQAYISRVPGIGTDSFIDRAAEWHNASIAAELGLNPVIVFNDKRGSQLSECLLNPQPLTPELLADSKYLVAAAQQLLKLHRSAKKFANDANIFKRNAAFHALITAKEVTLPQGYAPIAAFTARLAKAFERLDIPQVPCHMDTYYNNFLLNDDKLRVIDWEYSGNHDPIWDLAYFVRLAHLTEAQKNSFLMSYFASKDVQADYPFEYLRFIAYGIVINEFLILWTFVQIANKNFNTTEKELMVWSDYYLADSIHLMANQEFLTALQSLEEMAAKEENSCLSCLP